MNLAAACSISIAAVLAGCGDAESPAHCDGSVPLDGGGCALFGVGFPDPCLGGGNVIAVFGDADDFVHPGGPEFIRGGEWMIQPSVENAPEVFVAMRGPAPVAWALDFGSVDRAEPLALGIYENAHRLVSFVPGSPGLSVSGDGHGCNESTGRFQIHEIEDIAPSRPSFTATFENHCEHATAALRGCVHFEL